MINERPALENTITPRHTIYLATRQRERTTMSLWHWKLGIIVPSWNTVMEREVQRMAGETMSVHSMRIPHTADTEENLLGLGEQAPAAAQLLAHAKVNVICYGCAAGGFLKGPVADRALGERIARETAIPVAVSSAAVVEALTAFGAKRISLASPYAPWLNERLKQYFAAAGFDVLAMHGLDTQHHSGVTNERIEALIAQVDRPEAQAIFVSCSNFPTLAIIEKMEAQLGKPVVASNQASMWKMLRLLDDRQAVPGAGRLFREA
jgi:maleate cis-trans isomerase